MLEHALLGRLTLNSIPYTNPIVMGATGFMGLVVVVVLGCLTYFKKWGVFWRDWLTSVDHKKIGIMYIVLAFVMFLRGFSDAAMMRSQQALASGANMGYLPPEHYNQIFTAHGVIMIFFMAMAFMFGLVNLIVPLQIGARDVAYPFLNSLSFWLTVASAILINLSLFIGKFAATGWLAYPPLSELQYSPGVGVDYYLWALSISGIGTLIGGINIVATIVKMRCPGMTYFKMPMFTWSVLCAMVLVVIAFPVLNVTLFLLFLDRFAGMHFFTTAFGGNTMLYVNLIWTWGHPEVYILVLPAFGIYSEVIATFCKKALFGYKAMVYATAVITVLAFLVWLHHFFTMGAGADVNSFFGIMTMIISIPTGVKIFNWLATMFRGRIHFTTPMLWSLAFLVTFTIGGMTGVLMSVPGNDFQLHNSLFLVAHFHNTIIGGVVFGFFAGYYYWFPKAFGFKLHEGLGKCAIFCWVVGFYVAFMPLYFLGFDGMTRRLNHYPAGNGWHAYLIVAAVGALLIFIGLLIQAYQLVYSIIKRDSLRCGDDPWDARTLEWATSSPPKFYNFARDAEVNCLDPFWRAKQGGAKLFKGDIKDIHMPHNTSIGFITGIVAGIFGFAMVWNILWLAAITLVICIILLIVRTFNFNIDYFVKADKVKECEALSGSGV